MKTKLDGQMTQIVCGIIMTACPAVLAIKCVLILKLFPAVFMALWAFAGYRVTRILWRERYGK